MKLKELGIALGVLSIFLLGNLSLIVWNSLFAFYLLIVLAGVVSGIILVDIQKALMMYLITFAAAFVMSVWLSILPSYIIGATQDVNILVAAITSTLSRHVVISFPACIITGLLGCFIGGHLKERNY